MRAVVQRVLEAWVDVPAEDAAAPRQEVGRIGPGLLVLVGVAPADDRASATRLATRLAHLRVLRGERAALDRSVLDVGAAVLVVSQFTLLADTSRGRRPSLLGAAAPEVAAPLVAHVVSELRALGVTVATGRFGAEMRVGLVNDGPVTVILEA